MALTDRSNEAAKRRKVSLIAFCIAILVLSSIACDANAARGEEQVCDVRADYALGVENYPEAIRLHGEVVRKHPDNALAHYHLGFAEGMMGNKRAEVREYQVAAALGLKSWDLFLNLGSAQLDNGELDPAIESLQQAVLLAPNQFESHYNLALAFERRGLRADAEHEILASLRLNPEDPDARNTLGVIYAEEGRVVPAALVWRDLLRELPAYEPARANLALLGSPASLPLEQPSAPAAIVKTLADKRKTPAN